MSKYQHVNVILFKYSKGSRGFLVSRYFKGKYAGIPNQQQLQTIYSKVMRKNLRYYEQTYHIGFNVI